MPVSLGDAALVISECQRGVLDADVAVFPGIAQHAAERGVVDNIAALAHAFMIDNLLSLLARMTTTKDVIAQLTG